MFKQLAHDLLNLFYPLSCTACGKALNGQEKFLCFHCNFSLPKTDFHTYLQNPTYQIFYGRVPIKNAASFLYFAKDGMVQNMMHHLKYKNQKELGAYLGKMYGKILKEQTEWNQSELIIPVPLHKSKLRKRGYNQSESFAIGLSMAMDKPLFKHHLIRRRASETQTKKSRIARWENVADIFEIHLSEQLAGKKILLVDDVVTTGATLESCAQALLNSCKGIEINIATIAFAT